MSSSKEKKGVARFAGYCFFISQGVEDWCWVISFSVLYVLNHLLYFTKHYFTETQSTTLKTEMFWKKQKKV